MAGSSWLKAVVLVVLTVQTSVFHLVLRLSRSAGASHYSPLAAVVSVHVPQSFPAHTLAVTKRDTDHPPLM